MTRREVLWFIFGDLTSLKRCAALSVVVAAGYGFGRFADSYGLPQLCCLVGTALAIVALFCRSTGVGSTLEKIGAFALIGYVVVAVWTDALVFDGVVQSIEWVAPLLVAGVILPFRGSGLAGWGCWLLVFCCVSAATFNVYHVHTGMGFLVRWLA